MKKAILFIQGEEVLAELQTKDSTTYIAELYVFKILQGKFTGENVAIFENGDKFKGWV